MKSGNGRVHIYEGRVVPIKITFDMITTLVIAVASRILALVLLVPLSVLDVVFYMMIDDLPDDCNKLLLECYL